MLMDARFQIAGRGNSIISGQVNRHHLFRVIRSRLDLAGAVVYGLRPRA